jgi:tryptophan synthase alpha chain
MSKKFVAYLPASVSGVEKSIQAFKVLIDAGADVLEIGVPYSDPVMDGVTIQNASKKAIEGGYHINDIFEIISVLRKYNADVEIYIMSYYNPVFHFGLEKFARNIAAAGATGTIIPDLTPDEAGDWLTCSRQENLSNVFLTALNSSDQRIELVSKTATGFIYASSLLGVTGERSEVHYQEIEENIAKIRKANLFGIPIYAGLGISTAEQAQRVAKFSDGVIVGSRLVKALEVNLHELYSVAKKLADSIHSADINTSVFSNYSGR